MEAVSATRSSGKACRELAGEPCAPGAAKMMAAWAELLPILRTLARQMWGPRNVSCV